MGSHQVEAEGHPTTFLGAPKAAKAEDERKAIPYSPPLAFAPVCRPYQDLLTMRPIQEYRYKCRILRLLTGNSCGRA